MKIKPYENEKFLEYCCCNEQDFCIVKNGKSDVAFAGYDCRQQDFGVGLSEKIQ